MTIAEATRLDAPMLPGKPGKPAKQVDLRQPKPAPTDCPELGAALDAIGVPASSSLRDTIRWQQICGGTLYENRIRAGTETVPTAKALLACINANRDADYNVFATWKGAYWPRSWAFIWSHYHAIMRGPDARLYPDADALAEAMANYVHGVLAATAADGAAYRAQREAAGNAVGQVMAELAPLLERAIPQLEALADALSAAGKRDDAGEVRRNFVGVFRNLAAGKYRLPRD